MKYELLNENELENHEVGAAISVASVLAVLVAAAIAVVLYKVFISNKGSATIGGWKFNWN